MMIVCAFLKILRMRMMKEACFVMVVVELVELVGARVGAMLGQVQVVGVVVVVVLEEEGGYV